MAGEIDAIWAGDQLKRKSEARLVENFLESESRALPQMGRDQAVVLAIDAQYGEGKSWFLTRLRKQLELDHPVAFVDAWIDDANKEPLVSIMAALEDALRPFMKKNGVSDQFKALTRAAVPILAKAVTGAAGKFVGRYIGEEFGEDARNAVAAAAKAKGDDESTLAAAADKIVEGVAELAEGAAKAMLDQYRERQHSRRAFKKNLRLLAESIERTTEDPRQAPIIVVIDELDRCRPDYAISLLEEVKHLFDVPGVAFVVALHSRQLEHSIKAVYGNEFDAKDRLRRFFTRTYELRRLSIAELVVSLFPSLPSKVSFSMPEVWQNGKIVQMDGALVAGHLLTEWRARPREAQSVIDGLRLFIANWDHRDIAIELPLVMVMLLNLVRGQPVYPGVANSGPPELFFVTRGGGTGSMNATARETAVNEFLPAYNNAISANLVDIMTGASQQGAAGYATDRMRREFQIRFQGMIDPKMPRPRSTWSEYANRVRDLGRFVDAAPPAEEAAS